MFAAAAKTRTSTLSNEAVPGSLNIVISGVRAEDRILTRAETARWLRVDEDTLSRWSRQRRGPRAYRIGQHKTGYLISEILEWLHSQKDAPAIPCKRRRLWQEKAAREKREAVGKLADPDNTADGKVA
jgi:predicted DNA-binding transcriptional regulator AlpA